MQTFDQYWNNKALSVSPAALAGALREIALEAWNAAKSTAPQLRHNPDIDINGTSLQGEITVPFSKLVEKFGEPSTEVDGYKVAFEWALQFPCGTVATIYDYKASNLYDSDNPSPQAMREADFADWHIGGRSKKAVELVIQALKAA